MLETKYSHRSVCQILVNEFAVGQAVPCISGKMVCCGSSLRVDNVFLTLFEIDEARLYRRDLQPLPLAYGGSELDVTVWEDPV